MSVATKESKSFILIANAIIALGTIALFATGHPGWGSLGALVTLGLLAVATTTTFAGACPNCGTALTSLPHQCRRCLNFFNVVNGHFVECTDNAVCKSPLFEIPLPDSYIMPRVCCGCGGAPTRELAVSTSHGASQGGVVTHLATITIAAPFCERCKTWNVQLDSQSPVYVGAYVFKVGSLYFHREFLKLNRLGRYA